MTVLGPSRRHRRWVELGALGTLWAALYLPHLRTTPRWYGDETTAFCVARTLLHGQPHDQALRYIFAPYQALDLGLVALASLFSSGDIVGGRFVHALLALATAALILRYAVRWCGRAGAWVAAIAFLTAPQALTCFRMVMPHCGVAFGAAAVVLGLSGVPGPRRARVAGVGLLVAVGSHVSGLLLLPIALMGVWRWRRLWPTVLGPAALYVLGWLTWGMLVVRPWLLSDLALLAGRFGGADSVASIPVWRILWGFVGLDWLHAVGYAALVVVALRRRWFWAVGLLALTLLILPSRPFIRTFYYPALPLLPLLALGCGLIAHEVLRVARRAWPTRGRWVERAAVAGAVFGLAAPAWNDVRRGVLRTPYSTFECQSPSEVQDAAAWLDAHTQADDLVLANHDIAWLLHARTANLLQLTLMSGYTTAFSPHGVPPGRFLYDVSTARAKYVVIGDIDQRWTLHQEHVADALAPVVRDRWPSVWKGPNYEILANPGR